MRAVRQWAAYRKEAAGQGEAAGIEWAVDIGAVDIGTADIEVAQTEVAQTGSDRMAVDKPEEVADIEAGRTEAV